MSYKRSLSVILMVILTVMAAGSVSRPVYAETTLERLKKAKAEKEKTEDAKKIQRIGNNLWKLQKIHY